MNLVVVMGLGAQLDTDQRLGEIFEAADTVATYLVRSPSVYVNCVGVMIREFNGHIRVATAIHSTGLAMWPLASVSKLHKRSSQLDLALFGITSIA